MGRTYKPRGSFCNAHHGTSIFGHYRDLAVCFLLYLLYRLELGPGSSGHKEVAVRRVQCTKARMGGWLEEECVTVKFQTGCNCAKIVTRTAQTCCQVFYILVWFNNFDQTTGFIGSYTLFL